MNNSLSETPSDVYNLPSQVEIIPVINTVEKPQTPLLVNTTEFASPFSPSTREEKAWSQTVIRYYLQSLAKELLPYDHRINVCMHCMSPAASTVDVLKKPESKRAYYSGLMVCGMLWVCSVCATRITEERRQELTTALATGRYTALLATYTLRHNQTDSLKTLVDGMLAAFRRMKSGKAWQSLMAEYDWVGSIRALETTHGYENGWHPHQHELILTDAKLSKSAQNGLLVDLKAKWGNALRRQGLDTSWSYGVDLRAADKDVQEYVAKFGHEPVKVSWGIEHELTKAPVKKGRDGGRSPAQLLADYGDGDIAAGRLWQEYARVFKGRKQLVWSKGLRELLGMGAEAADEELAESLPDGVSAHVLARLKPDQWRAIKRADLRGEVLEAAESNTPEDFSSWLSEKLEKWL